MGERFLQSRVTVCVVFKNKVFSFPSKNLTSIAVEAKFALYVKNCSSFSFKIQFSILSLSCFPCLCGIKRIGVLNEWHGSPLQLYPPSPPPPINSFSISLAFPEQFTTWHPIILGGGGEEVKCVFHAF